MNINIEKIKKVLAVGSTFVIVTSFSACSHEYSNNKEGYTLESTSIVTESDYCNHTIAFILNNEKHNVKIKVSYQNLECYLKENIYIIPNYEYQEGSIQFIKRDSNGIEEILNVEKEDMDNVLREGFNLVDFTYDDCLEKGIQKNKSLVN